MFIANNQLTIAQMSELQNLLDEVAAVDQGIPSIYSHLLVTARVHNSNGLFYQNNRLVGFIALYFFYPQACEISLVVAPAYRRQGIATVLLQQMMPLLHQRATKRLIFSMAAAIPKEWLQRYSLQYYSSEYRMERSKITTIESVRSLIIRSATVADVSELQHIDSQCFPADVPTSGNRFVALIEDPNYVIYFVYLNNQPIGKAHIHWEQTETFFSDIAILPSYQHQGYGSQLLEFCINNALARCKNPIILTVLSNNQEALGLYLKYDFQIANEQVYWSIDTNQLKFK